MIEPRAFCFYKEFAAEPEKEIQFDRHYLLYAAKGAMRFETDNKSWVLPPSRAAWIAANRPIKMHCIQNITCCSVLFATDFVDCPTDSCLVFEMNRLGREMILNCRQWGPDFGPLASNDVQFFSTLANVCTDLAKYPSNTWTPAGRSTIVRRAIDVTRLHLSDNISFDAMAKQVGASPRNLARRINHETGHTWRQLQRRMRMISAVEQLADCNQSLANVGLAVGYGSQSAFNSAFKAFFGITPAAYRKASLQ